MPDRVEVRDLSFLTLLALQDADRFRRGEATDAWYMKALSARLDEILDLDGAGLRAMAPSSIMMYAKAAKAAAGREATDLEGLAASLRPLLGSLRSMIEKNAAGATATFEPADLHAVTAFLRSLYDQLLAQKQREAAKRASRSVRRRD